MSRVFLKEVNHVIAFYIRPRRWFSAEEHFPYKPDGLDSDPQNPCKVERGHLLSLDPEMGDRGRRITRSLQCQLHGTAAETREVLPQARWE